MISANGFRDLHRPLGEPPAKGICLTPFDASVLPADLASDTALILYTSGSSGAPQPIAKTLAQLDAELTALEHLWGKDLGDTLVVNLVSHHHMFGLPFGILWPLARGTLFYTRTVHYPEPLEALARQYRLTLVCSPIHLQHLPDKLEHTIAQTAVARVFSAGSLLEADIAQRCDDLFGKPVTEIYGSTETGAVAWRQYPDDIWRCLPEVTVDHPPRQEDSSPHTTALNPLRIMSPALPADSRQVMADVGCIHSPTHFTLGGRTDRIAKVGGKRVSLTALESRLLDHPWVQKARVLPLSERKGRLGAVVILEPQGKHALIDGGRRAVSGLLRAHMAETADPIALPRYWRYVSRLPMNTQGKCTTAALTDLFVEARQSQWPTLLDGETVTAGQHCRLTLHIPDQLYYFNGHFPGNPVLPGVVQIHWAIHYAREAFDVTGEFSALEAIKFQRIIQPGAVVTLELRWQAEHAKLQFSYHSGELRHSSGRVLLGQEKIS